MRALRVRISLATPRNLARTCRGGRVAIPYWFRSYQHRFGLILCLFCSLTLCLLSVIRMWQTLSWSRPFAMRLDRGVNHHLAYESGKGMHRTVSAITCIIRSDLDFLSSFAQNVRDQFDCPHTEILLAVYDQDAFDQAVFLFKNIRCPVKIIKFLYDPGLYKSWDVLISNYATGDLLTTAAVDDRRRAQSLRKAVSLFRSNKELGVLSFAIEAVAENGTSQGVWWGSKNIPHLTRVSPSMMVKTNSSGVIIGSENLPHCAPVWRRSLHTEYGMFASRFNECSDYAFFLRVVLGNEKILHFSKGPAGVAYMVRQSSHNRRDRDESETPCEELLFQSYGLHSSGLYNNLMYGKWGNMQETKRRVAIITEALPLNQEGGNNRLMQVVEFLVLNGHSVTIFARSGWDAKDSTHSGFLRRFGVETVVDSDPNSMSDTISRLCMMEFDTTFFFLWFWRYWDDGLPTQAELLLRNTHCAPVKSMVVFSDDVHHRRCAQIGLSRSLCNNVELQEREVYATAALVLSITQDDEASFMQLGAAHTETLPYVIPAIQDKDDFGDNTICLNGRFRVTYIGSAHDANYAAVSWFLENVVPELSHVPAWIRFTFVGSQQWELLTLRLGVDADTFDRTEDLARLLRETRILLAPVTVNATGISTKVFDSLAHGIPCVTTPAGAAGIDDAGSFLQVVPVTKSSLFAARLQHLISDDELWRNVSSAIRKHAPKYTRQRWLHAKKFMHQLQMTTSAV